MSTPPIHTADDLRRLAMNAGAYGTVTVPAAAVLDFIEDQPDMGEAPSKVELERLIRNATRAADDAAMAADELAEATKHLRECHEYLTPPNPNTVRSTTR